MIETEIKRISISKPFFIYLFIFLNQIIANPAIGNVSIFVDNIFINVCWGQCKKRINEIKTNMQNKH